MYNSKRKRHSGGAAKPSALSSHVEEHLMFNMDDHDTSDAVFSDGQTEEADDKGKLEVCIKQKEKYGFLICVETQLCN